jgi:predicted ATPase
MPIPSFDQSQLDKLIPLETARAFPKNTLLIAEGDQSDQIYIVITGRLKVYLSGADGKEVEARRLLEDALTLIVRTEHRMHEAGVYRVLGNLRQQQSNPDVEAAEQHYRKAIEVARSQSAKGFELRAATTLARMWRQQDRCREARALPAPIYEWFTEGLGTRDLVEARALLEELDTDA